MAANLSISQSDPSQSASESDPLTMEERLALVERYAHSTDPEESKRLEDELLDVYFGECPS